MGRCSNHTVELQNNAHRIIILYLKKEGKEGGRDGGREEGRKGGNEERKKREREEGNCACKSIYFYAYKYIGGVLNKTLNSKYFSVKNENGSGDAEGKGRL